MVTKAIRRIRKSKESNEKDFYQTYPGCTHALIEVLEPIGMTRGLEALDPCCGRRAITNVLETYFTDIDAFDKFEGDNNQDFLEYEKEKDIIIMNPPYSRKYEFIDHAMDISRIVICLLPLNISNYNMFHAEYENVPEFVGKVLMTPKIFLHDGTEMKSGGTSAYAWYIWKKDNKTDTSLTWYKDLREIKARQELENNE